MNDGHAGTDAPARTDRRVQRFADEVMAPLLTPDVHRTLVEAARARVANVRCSLDLGRSTATVEVGSAAWTWAGQSFPYLEACRDRTIYYWDEGAFRPAARYSTSLVKLVPTEWGPPTFEIDGIKMLPTARVSPYEDARQKVGLIRPRGKVVLDTCGGLGYFAAWCLQGQAARVISYERNRDVLWLRGLNPWSPPSARPLVLVPGDVVTEIGTLPDESVDAILHDPPRFGIAGELYSHGFYAQLARVLRRNGMLFHYTGAPNSRSRGRDLPAEVAKRLRSAGFEPRVSGDGVLATKPARLAPSSRSVV